MRTRANFSVITSDHQYANVYCEQIRIRGLVQGVGFRPTVWNLANHSGIKGLVLNDGSGVLIIAQSSENVIDLFLSQLKENPPPLARIESIEREKIRVEGLYSEFTIQKSVSNEIHTGIVPDAATCKSCLEDIENPDNRRFNYAFTNCTHCGPRLSIIRDIPYDRLKTSMNTFTMCDQCQSEYEDPTDRRFHAQPNACPDCGPKLWLTDKNDDVIQTDNIIKKIATLIESGHIVAIKGIGGFQLACDATNDDVVSKLRHRKKRPHKPFALMAKDQNQISNYCRISDVESKQLSTSAAPIILLQKRTDNIQIAQTVAPTSNNLGFMLPYSPLHYLLMQQLKHPVVLTSGNKVEEPQCIDNNLAIIKLNTIADYFVMHDRDIINRIDDSVMMLNSSNQADDFLFLRRARGYSPSPINLPKMFNKAQNILAFGAEMKNTFCLLKDGKATLSQHIGNLENSSTFEDYLHNLKLYGNLFNFKSQINVIDQHPEYLSSKLGYQQSDESNLPLIQVQHHHAHIASCMAENNWEPKQGKVIGVAMDGLGLGDDGTIWGGEFLLTDYLSYQRVAKIKSVPMPGGTKSIMEPWRNLFSQLYTFNLLDDDLVKNNSLLVFQKLSNKPIDVIKNMISKQINTPYTSSCGRLFDAVAAVLDICFDKISFEGQAAIQLESIVSTEELSSLKPYPYDLEHTSIIELNFKKMWQNIFSDLLNNQPPSSISTRFHKMMANAICDVVLKIKNQSSISTVALSGGVFQNQILFKLCVNQLTEYGFQVLYHKQVPTNDGGISLGQAVIAAAQTLKSEKEICV